MTQRDTQKKKNPNVHNRTQIFCISDVFYQPQTGV